MSEQAVSLTSEFVSDPARYPELREQGPLARVVLPQLETPVWLVTGYEDAKAALNDPRFIRDSTKLPGQEGPSIVDQMIAAYGLPAEYSQYLGILMLQDGTEHARVRKLLTRSFTARRVNASRPLLEKLTAGIVATRSAMGEVVDLIEAIGYPVAGEALCRLIGVDEADRADVQSTIRQYASGNPETFVPALQSIVEYAKDLIARRRAERGDDLISDLLGAADEAGAKDALSETELIAIFLLLVNTGITPPAEFLCRAVLALLDHPDQLAKLRAQPEILGSHAVPELLRFLTSAPMSAPMYATEDLEFQGCPVKQGEAVSASLLALNHDPREFAAPEKLDLTRELGSGTGHMAFGHGPHLCIGAALSRMQTEVVIDQLLLKHEGLQVAGEREYRGQPGEGMHLINLPVRF
ncbi:cytochrome P450 (plasmid) [Streptomyces lunaelactis]|uniref:Cytochrome P450 n=1 Tax=Streptomyces lunaelactis TaxID=1535768 RepID=A0A2R4TFL5_9ACTN|nr:cytochrome P450 [Streptomyces lunaelactis]AVZ77904.1 cytochrome P450 [Streptomyces lunaelactis]NUK83435.1 cytochrome P450 [Streptomyces lunaelactis]